jgi:excisionase family DNA binding protein
VLQLSCNRVLPYRTTRCYNGRVPEARRYDVTTEEAAAAVGVHPETIRRWARTRYLPARKSHAGWWLFSQDDLEALPVRVVVEERAAAS